MMTSYIDIADDQQSSAVSGEHNATNNQPTFEDIHHNPLGGSKYATLMKFNGNLFSLFNV